MKVKLIAALCLLFSASVSFAQSKVFNQVSDEISTQMKVITQDDALIGYLVFTQLEKASEDSFNYKVSILDENLNDIGTLNFREQSLNLQAVSFEQDVLCLAYIKSNVIGNKYPNARAYRKAVSNIKNSIFTQFINLQGKIIQTNNYNAEINAKESYPVGFGQKLEAAGDLKHDLVLKNIPRLGFACFFGDEIKNKLITFNTAGKQVWMKDVPEADGFALLSTEENIYILSKKKSEMLEGGFEVRGYRVMDATAYDRYVLKDKKGNSLKVLGFDNDPATGKPLITGNIINSRYGDKGLTAKKLTKGAYEGVFTVALNGPKKSDIKETYSYWNDGSQSSISNTGLYVQNNTYGNLSGTIRDYNGNTYFIGSSLIKRPKWGTIITSVALAPFVFVSPLLLLNGTNKCKVTDAVLLKQDANGKLSIENTIPCDASKFYPARAPMTFFNTKKFYNVSNATSKSNFLIVDDLKNIVIYNVNSKKVMRTVPHKDGNTIINIFPAKEGHIMVSEFNKKEKYTRLSIEALS